MAVLLTAPSVSAIAVVRLTGSGTDQFLRDHFSKPTAIGRCVHGDLRDGDTVLDDAVVVRVAEDVADLNLHGGRWIVQSVMDLAKREGFEIASSSADEPLPLDAVDGADLLEREMLASLPLARTERAVRELLRQPEIWRARAASDSAVGFAVRTIFNAGSHSEACMRGGPPIQDIAADRSLWRLLHPPTVAIVGAANVGKSTLANQLFAQERSITANVPGTTRDWVGDLADIDGLAVHLIDTPGLRATGDPIEAEAIRLAESRIASADLLILVLDATRPDDAEQHALLKSPPPVLRGRMRVGVLRESVNLDGTPSPTLSTPETPTLTLPRSTGGGDRGGILVAMNKVDLAPSWHASAMPLVAATGRGIDALRAAVTGFFGISPTEPAHPRWWTPRQRDLLLGMS